MQQNDLTLHDQIRAVLDTINQMLKIIEVIEATIQLKESPDYELYDLMQRDASILDTVSEKQKQDIERECGSLTGEAQDLANQIEELAGAAAFDINPV